VRLLLAVVPAGLSPLRRLVRWRPPRETATTSQRTRGHHGAEGSWWLRLRYSASRPSVAKADSLWVIQDLNLKPMD
jgi:hypothetical protein